MQPDKTRAVVPDLAPDREARAAHIAIFLDHLRGGGVQKMRLIIARGLAERGHRVDLVLCDVSGPLRDQVPETVNLVELRPAGILRAGALVLATDPGNSGALLTSLLLSREISPTLRYFPDLVRYLKVVRPDAILSATPDMNIEASLARRRAGVAARLVVSEHNTLLQGHPLGSGWRGSVLASMLRRAYRHVDAIIGVSDGVAEDIVKRTGLPRESVRTVYNPTVTPGLLQKVGEPLDHPWFSPDCPPVILGVGRLGDAKDFPNLIRAFARVREQRPVRLVILGEAKKAEKTAKRQLELMSLAGELGVDADVQLPGFVQNPYAYMARAAVFAMSSVHEGLPNVLIEALACGCPAVSTDCPSGPAEILEYGRFGPLVPLRDHVALADAIVRTLESPPDAKILRERGAMFSVERAVNKYEELLLGPAAAAPPAEGERKTITMSPYQ